MVLTSKHHQIQVNIGMLHFPLLLYKTKRGLSSGRGATAPVITQVSNIGPLFPLVEVIVFVIAARIESSGSPAGSGIPH
jgi:hypothetical protein